jgi:hypothetical protein
MLDVRLGTPQHHQHLTIYPLLALNEHDLSYLLLIDAINTSLVEITEKDGGTVPTLIARNSASDAVLVLDGEQLIGARQNRMTNRSILLPAHSAIEIPVYCMEQGRWQHRTSSMSTKPHFSPSKVRKYARTVEADYSERGEMASPQMLSEAQGGVWNEIREVSAMIGAQSASGALDHVYDVAQDSIDTWLAHFPAVPHQVGLLAFVGNQPLGLDVIGGVNVYSRLHQRFLYGYVMDALTTDVIATSRPPVTGEEYLDRVRTAARSATDSVGCGTYNVLSGRVVGGELNDEEQLVHLSAFPRDERAERHGLPGNVRFDAPLPPPSRRRRS